MACWRGCSHEDLVGARGGRYPPHGYSHSMEGGLPLPGPVAGTHISPSSHLSSCRWVSHQPLRRLRWPPTPEAQPSSLRLAPRFVQYIWYICMCMHTETHCLLVECQVSVLTAQTVSPNVQSSIARASSGGTLLSVSTSGGSGSFKRVRPDGGPEPLVPSATGSGPPSPFKGPTSVLGQAASPSPGENLVSASGSIPRCESAPCAARHLGVCDDVLSTAFL